jgi:hypothetical protein
LFILEKKIPPPVFSPRAGDEFGGKNPAAIFLATFHHPAEFSPAETGENSSTVDFDADLL